MTKKKADKYIAKMDEYFNKEKARNMVPHMQTQLYVMCGMGMMGQIAAQQPSCFYIEPGVRKLPYNQKDIKFIARVLAKLVVIAGLEESLAFNSYNHIEV